MPTPTVDTPVVLAQGFTTAAQQNIDQKIKFSPPSALTCDGGKVAPCGLPPAGIASFGIAGPYVVSSTGVPLPPPTLSNFTITPPANYTSPTQYRITSMPGSNLSAAQYATMRFYAATRTGKPYSYSANVSVTYEMRSWASNGTTVTWSTNPQRFTRNATVTCRPSTTPACSFSVLGSNVG